MADQRRPSRPPARRRIPRVVPRLAAALAVVLACATACSEPEVETEPSIGQVERTESMDALGMALVTNGEGAARLVWTLVDKADEPDRLVGVDVEPTVESFDVVLADGPIICLLASRSPSAGTPR